MNKGNKQDREELERRIESLRAEIAALREILPTLEEILTRLREKTGYEPRDDDDPRRPNSL